MDLGHNHFTGVIPSEIGNLRRLEFLLLNNNDFQGRLPREIGLLNNMSKFQNLLYLRFKAGIALNHS